MFWTVRLSIIRSLFTVHAAMVYVVQVCRTAFEQGQARPDPAWKLSYKPVWHIPLLRVQWINSWWWTDELSETCTVSCQNKFVKLVHIVGVIIKKFVCRSCCQLAIGRGSRIVGNGVWCFVHYSTGGSRAK